LAVCPTFSGLRASGASRHRCDRPPYRRRRAGSVTTGSSFPLLDM